MRLEVASNKHQAFAEKLVVSNMMPYYKKYGLQWDGDLFKEKWAASTNFVVLVDSIQVGFVSLVIETDVAYVRDVHLLPDYQGTGIGTKLMMQIEKSVSERGCRSLRLRVFRCNPAVRLYKRLGWRIALDESVTFGMEKLLPLEGL